MIECFEYWCPPCRKSIPHISQMAQKYKNVYIVSVAQQEKDQVQKLVDIIPYMQKYNISFDESGQLGQFNDDNKINGIPHCYIFDKDEQMIYSGHPLDQKVEKILEQLNDGTYQKENSEENLLEEQEENDDE